MYDKIINSPLERGRDGKCGGRGVFVAWLTHPYPSQEGNSTCLISNCYSSSTTPSRSKSLAP
jgi:hypothetical protein